MGYGPNLAYRPIYTESTVGTLFPMTEEGIRNHYQNHGFEVLKIEQAMDQLHVDVQRLDNPQVMKFGFYVGDMDFFSRGGCRHEFKTYVGFSESYRYCTKCDHKENT